MQQRSARAVRPGHGDLELRVAGMRHQRDREFAVRILGGHLKSLGPPDPCVVERRIVHSGITLDYEITETGGLGRQVVASIDDDHLLSRIVQSAGHQAPKRTEADDDYMIGEVIELVFHLLILPKRHYGIAGKDAGQTGHGIAADGEEGDHRCHHEDLLALVQAGQIA